MAFFRLEAKIISREKRGRSVVSASAYRSGSSLKDERYETIRDFARRSNGVIETEILVPEGAPEWAKDAGQLWNRVEKNEKRADAQLAREFVLAVPPELSASQQFELAKDWAKQELVGRGMIAEVSLHHTKSGRNPHVHILCTMRRLDGNQFSAQKAREWNEKPLLRQQRKSWGAAVNTALEKAGRPERVDHRSLKDRGIDRIPEPKIGVAATAMKRRGVVADPFRFQLVRYVKSLNAARPWLKAIEKIGEVHQRGVGKTWWERSLIFGQGVREVVRETVMDTWRSLASTRLPKNPNPIPIPSPDRGPGFSR
jgi:ATP-dependent exoDNAse (exonuclease V) alpha subunit